jgi:AraC-like DNA-binding protein
MSRSQLFRKMKALTDTSPSDFIRDYRMQQAKILLESRQFSVKEVAYKVGFKDLSHFSKTFQDAFGFSPSYFHK